MTPSLYSFVAISIYCIQSRWKEKMTPPSANPSFAALLVLAAMAIIGLIDTAVPRIGQDVGLWQFLSVRSLIVVPLLCLATWGAGAKLRPNRAWAVGVRGACIAIAMLIYFGCLLFIPYGQVVAGIFTAPIFVMLITAFYLRVPLRATQWAAVIIGFMGLLFVVQPQSGMSPVTFLPVLAGVFYALGAVATRHLCEGEPTMALMVGFFALMGLGALGGLVFFEIFPALTDGGFIRKGWSPMTSMFGWLLMLQVAGSMSGMYLLTRAYQTGDAPLVSSLEYSLLIYAAFYGWLLLGQTINGLTLIGIGLILLSGVLTVRQPAVQPA
jgi:drug/metabolite transporter (DMT)-like permease